MRKETVVAHATGRGLRKATDNLGKTIRVSRRDLIQTLPDDEVRILRRFIICSHPQISLGSSSQGDEVDGVCGTRGRGEKNVQAFARFQIFTAASMMFRVVFWDLLPCKIIVDRRFRGAYLLHHGGSTYLWNVGRQLFYTTVHPRRQIWTCTIFWWESPKERDHLEDGGVDGRIGSEWILGRLAGRMLSGFNWLTIGSSGRLLWMRRWTCGFWRHGFSLSSRSRHSVSSLYAAFRF
jgi:hypothetical protein